MAEFDLSAERAKRSRESKSLIMKDEDGAVLSKYELVAEFPADAFDLSVEGKIGAAIRSLFINPEDADDFINKHKPSVDDFVVIMRGIYGLDNLGEYSASGS